MTFEGLAIVLMGVSGSGKSTIGKLLSQQLGCPFIDADDYHSVDNKEKMQQGVPLTDLDRFPWLESIRDALIDYIIKKEPIVLGCSALKANYRDILRTADYSYALSDQTTDLKGRLQNCKIIFVYLQGSQELLKSRLQARFSEGKHFMPVELLQSQMESLEIVESEKVIMVDVSQTPEIIVEKIKSQILALLPEYRE